MLSIGVLLPAEILAAMSQPTAEIYAPSFEDGTSPAYGAGWENDSPAYRRGW